MQQNFHLTFCVFFLIFVASVTCSNQVGEAERPSPPRLIASPPDTAIDERGIDAIPERDAIQLDWAAQGGGPLRGFKLYRSEERKTGYRLLANLSERDTTYTDVNNLELWRRYFYFMTSVDQDGRQSSPSDTLDYMLVDKAFNLFATPEVRPLFRWQVKSNPAQYVVKVFENDTDRKIWVSVVNSDYGDLDEEVRFNADGAAVVDSLQRGRTYKWRVDIIGPESNSGSESAWKRLTVSR